MGCINRLGDILVLLEPGWLFGRSIIKIFAIVKLFVQPLGGQWLSVPTVIKALNVNHLIAFRNRNNVYKMFLKLNHLF